MIIRQILTRFYVEDMDCSIAFYEQLLGELCVVRIKAPGLDLEIARVGSVLLFKGEEGIIQEQKQIDATFIVDSVEQFKEQLTKNGAEVVEEPRVAPAGICMRVRHPDQSEIEYVQPI